MNRIAELRAEYERQTEQAAEYERRARMSTIPAQAEALREFARMMRRYAEVTASELGRAVRS